MNGGWNFFKHDLSARTSTRQAFTYITLSGLGIALSACGHSQVLTQETVGQAAAPVAQQRLQAPLQNARFEQPGKRSRKAAPKAPRAMDDAALAALLRDLGFESSVVEPGVIRYKESEAQCLLFNLKDGDLQLYFAIDGLGVNLETINGWNHSHRLSRAYLDKQNDPVLEADLLANGGLTADRVRAFVLVFAASRRAFTNFLLESKPSESSTPRAEPAQPEDDIILRERRPFLSL